MKKKILVLLYKDFVMFEISLATFILSDDFELHTASPDVGIIKEWSGLAALAEFALDEIDPADYEALIIPGGKFEKLLEKTAVTALIQKFSAEGKLIAAICAAPIHLAKAGVLTGRQFTTSLRAEDDPDHYFNWDNFVQTGVVVDGPVITADGNAFVDFAIAIAEHLGLIQDAERKKAYQKYYKNLD